MCYYYTFGSRAYARVHCTIFFVYYFYSRTFRFLCAVSCFLHWLNKTRRKQSVNPIHELRNTCDRLTIYFSHCVRSQLAHTFLFGSAKSLLGFYSNIYYWTAISISHLTKLFGKKKNKKKKKGKMKQQKKRSRKWLESTTIILKSFNWFDSIGWMNLSQILWPINLPFFFSLLRDSCSLHLNGLLNFRKTKSYQCGFSMNNRKSLDALASSVIWETKCDTINMIIFVAFHPKKVN